MTAKHQSTSDTIANYSYWVIILWYWRNRFSRWFAKAFFPWKVPNTEEPLQPHETHVFPKLNTFIVALRMEKKKMQFIVLIVHYFHSLISEEHWDLLLILDIKVRITLTRNKHFVLVINITIVLHRKPLKLPQSLKNQITPFHINPMTPLRKSKKLIRK